MSENLKKNQTPMEVLKIKADQFCFVRNETQIHLLFKSRKMSIDTFRKKCSQQFWRKSRLNFQEESISLALLASLREL